MKTFKVTAETYRGWTRWGLSLNGVGPGVEASVHGAEAVTDPFNDRRVVGNGLLQVVDPNTNEWTDFVGVVSWDVGEVPAGGPFEVAAQSNDKRVTMMQEGPARLKVSPFGRVSYEVDLNVVIL